jgi:hypothetical protein
MKIKLMIPIGVSIFACSFIFWLSTDTGNSQGSPTTISGKFYRFDFVAIQGQNNINFNIGGTPSINDSGVIAFSASTTDTIYDRRIYDRSVNGPITQLYAPGPGGYAYENLQVNNNNQVVANLSVNFVTGVYLLDGNSPGTTVTISAPDNNFNVSHDNRVSLNNSSQAAFLGRRAEDPLKFNADNVGFGSGRLANSAVYSNRQ